MIDVEYLKKIRRTRAKVIRGNYTYEESDRKIDIPLEELPIAGSGKIALRSEGEENRIALKYNSEKFTGLLVRYQWITSQ